MKKLLAFIFSFVCVISFAQQGPLSGSTFTNVVISGSTTSWTNTGNAAASDNTYTAATNNLPGNGGFTDYFQATNFGFTIPSGATITGITVEIEDFDDDNGASGRARDNKVMIVKGGVIRTTDNSINSFWATSDPNSYTTYGSSSDLWGETWTAADINSSNFGFAISAKRQGGGGMACFPTIDHIRITVNYTASLPIELMYFNANELTNNSIELSWETATETNNDYFLLERSTDAISFNTVSKINGAGNSTSYIKYKFVDNYKTTNKVLYYRLSQVDYDGKKETFKLLAVSISDKQSGVLVYPNPTNESITIEVKIPCQKINMSIVDMYGNILNKFEFLGDLTNKYTLEMNKGIHECILNIEVDGVSYSRKIIVN